MASDADTTYKATAPAVSSRALKCYTACYDGKLEEVKRVVNQPNQPKLDVNAEIVFWRSMRRLMFGSW